MLRATRPNEKWSMDCVAARLLDGRWFRVLTVVDQFTRECVLLLADSSLTGHKVALVIADPERFATINDSVGRHGGDQLLQQVAERLTTTVGDANEVARISSNQFAAV